MIIDSSNCTDLASSRRWGGGRAVKMLQIRGRFSSPNFPIGVVKAIDIW